MISGANTQLSPREDYYKDTLTPSVDAGTSFIHNVAKNIGSPIVGFESATSAIDNTPLNDPFKSFVDQVNDENANPNLSWPAYLTGQVGGMVGSILNPLNLFGGAIGGKLASGVTDLVGSAAEKILPDAATTLMRTPLTNYLPEKLSKYVPEMIGKGDEAQTLSAALLSKKTIENFGIGAGFGVPDAIADNYKADSRHIEWGGVGKDMGMMGAWGIALPIPAYALGMIIGKVRKIFGKAPNEPVSAGDMAKAGETGEISPAELQFTKDYDTAKASPKDVDAMQKLKEDGSSIVNQNGLTANTASHEAPFNIMDNQQMRNLFNAVYDRVSATELPENQRGDMTDFIVHDAMDGLKQDPKHIDGIRGYVAAIDEKLAAKPEMLARADEILDNHIDRGMKDAMPMSQKELVKQIKKTGLTAEQAERLPLTIPQSVLEHVNQLDHIKKYKKNNKRLFKDYKKTGNQKHVIAMQKNNDVISYKIEHLPPLMTPKEELHYIKNTMFPKIKLREASVKGQFFDNHSFESEHARVEFQEHTDRITVDGALVDSKVKGQGHAKAVYKKVIEYALSKGKTFTSDKQLSLQAARIYTSLEKQGYKFEKNPTTYLNNKSKTEIEHWATKDGKPVYTLLSAPAKLSGNYLPKNFRTSKEFQRLLDLSNVWHNARTLVDRIELEDQYNKQEAFRDLSKMIVDLADAPVEKYANSDKALAYMKERHEPSIKKPVPTAEINTAADTKMALPAEADAILADSENQIRNSAAPEGKEDFSAAKQKFDRFKSSEGIFKNLIACVMGASANG